jgi:replicative DNA helicase
MLLGARDKVPNLADPEALDRLFNLIRSDQIEVLAIDPFYLAVGPTKSGGVNHNDMFAMGHLLYEFASTVQAAGATAIITHHFTKPRARGGAGKIPELADLAHAGIGQFARQWILVDRRAPFDPNQNVHELHLVMGGYGHSSYHAIDVSMAPQADGLRQWDIAFSEDASSGSSDPAKSRRERRRSQGNPSDATHTEVLAALAFLGGKATARKIRDTTRWSQNKVDRVTSDMLSAGKLRRVEVSVACGNGKMRACEGFEAVGEPIGESQAG